VELPLEPNYEPQIRESIIDKVNSVLWLDKLVAEDNAYQDRLLKSRSTTEKCMICTLPYGTCEHTRQWISEAYERRTRIPDDEDLDRTINDMLSVVGDFKLETQPVLEDIALDEMQWKALEERPTDKIGATNVCLFSPDERGWHSTTRLSTNLVLVFGGLKYRINQTPPLFTTEPHPDEVEFLNDLRAYDTQNLAWYGIRGRGKKNGERDLLYLRGEDGTELSTEYGVTTGLQGTEPGDTEIFEMPEGRYGESVAGDCLCVLLSSVLNHVVLLANRAHSRCTGREPTDDLRRARRGGPVAAGHVGVPLRRRPLAAGEHQRGAGPAAAQGALLLGRRVAAHTPAEAQQSHVEHHLQDEGDRQGRVHVRRYGTL
jgi:hypothetical protein